MKKQQSILVTLTGIFAAFLLGFFLGRNVNHTDVQLTTVAEAASMQETTAEVQLAVLSTSAPTETQTIATESSVPAESEAPASDPTEPPETDSTAETAETQIPTTEAPASEDNGLININTATLSQLVTLPGIGDVIGQRIIDYRDTYGPFTSVGQLINVKGIGEKKLADIINLVTVD